MTILAVHDAGGLRANVGVAPDDRTRFDSVVEAWVSWFRPRAGRVESPAWIPDRLEYGFAMTAPVAEGTATLTAPEHSGGALEWFTFTGAQVTPGVAGTPVRTTVDIAPTLLHIAGMPALTFWEIEDPSFDPGRIDLGFWPAFNLADTFIVVGVAILLGALVLADRKPRPPRRTLDVAAR